MEWIHTSIKPPAKNFPILVLREWDDFPSCVLWKEDGTYGDPAFFERNEEYEIREKDIIYWMPVPKWPSR